MQSTRRCRRLTVIASAFVAASAVAQPSLYESEPNDTPAEANPVTGAATLIGAMAPGDQDAFLWTVSDVDARTRWTLELHGIPGTLTIVDILQVELSENGLDVLGRRSLLKLASRDGSKPVLVEDLVFEPGEYLLGIARAGAASPYRPPAASVGFGDSGAALAAGEEPPGGYRLAIREGRPLQLDERRAGNASRDAARALRANAHLAELAAGASSWYRFSVTEESAAARWELVGQVAVGREVRGQLSNAAGEVLARGRSDSEGRLAIPDLGLDAGEYVLELTGEETGGVRVVQWQTTGVRVEGEEAEPNDSWQQANRVDPLRGVRGRMGQRGDRDYFRFDVPEELADDVLRLTLQTPAEGTFRFQLLDGQGRGMQFRDGGERIDLADLVLAQGEYGFLVERGPEGAVWSVELASTGKVAPGSEIEPNDRIEHAQAIPTNNRINGRFTGDDTDIYKIIVTESPQLWRFQVIGDGVREVAYLDAAGAQTQRVRPPRGERRIRLENVYLMPGVHHVAIRGDDGGEYTLLARPLGPPDPNGEREPNDDTSRMQPLRMNQTRTGLLPDTVDRDNYRFSLRHWDHIRLEVRPPADGELTANLHWDGSVMRHWPRAGVGEPVQLAGVFPPGDYRLELWAVQPSDAEYTVSLARLPRFSCAVDCEPNDNRAFASPLPAAGIIEGELGEWRDPDWFALPVPETHAELVVRASRGVNLEVVGRMLRPNLLVRDPGGDTWRAQLPAGEAAYLHLRGSGPYRVQFAMGANPTLEPADAASAAVGIGSAGGPPAFTATLDVDATEVGAYLPYGQRVRGRLEFASSSDVEQILNLQAVASDLRWRVLPESSQATLPPRASITVPVTIEVPADAWGDTAVRISAAGSNAGGERAEAFVAITPRPDAPARDPVRWYALPESLRGGLNVAWSALGSKRTPLPDETERNPGVSHSGRNFDEIIDGMAVKNQGLVLRGDAAGEPLEVTVELAGAPVEVAGVAVHPLGMGDARSVPLRVQVALSADGEHFTTAIDEPLLPYRAEQAFPLDEPVTARFARLTLGDTFTGTPSYGAAMGEWKVIARPGVDLSGGHGFNLATPELGGHVVWAEPPSAAGWDQDLLTADAKVSARRLRPGQHLSWVVGFHHNRAARVASLEWEDSASAADRHRIRTVAVAIAMESPLGPWTPLAEWDLSATASVQRLPLPGAPWARFVRFTAVPDPSQDRLWPPEALRIIEQPTGSDYYSALAEWGFASRAASYEATQPIAIAAAAPVSGNERRETAASIAPGDTVSGQVALGATEHWYRVTLSAGQNTLLVTLSDEPALRAALRIEDADGHERALRPVELLPGNHRYETVAEPGETLWLNLYEPPRNVAFLWDTSASVGAYLPVVYNALASYAEGIVAGRDGANYYPFGAGALMKDWYGEPYVLQTVLNDYPRKESSSDAERTLARAARDLAERIGTRAVVFITDAATPRHAQVWAEFERTRPQVFAVGLGSEGAFGRNPPREQDLMQDWASVNGGHYELVANEGEMEVAFDRASSMLRRPAPYTLAVASDYREAPGPGKLAIVSSKTDNGAHPHGAVHFILDASGSMLQRMEGRRRIEIAREILIEAVTTHLAPGTPVALRVFGHREPGTCRSDLEIPLAPLDPAAARDSLAGVQAMNLARTPIADSLARVEQDLAQAQGRRVVVLLTDGKETCDGDPAVVIQALQEKGIEVSLNIVGFAIDDAELEQQFARWAELGGGRYFPAGDSSGLREAMRAALQTPFAVYDRSGLRVAEGVVGGEPLELEQGIYRVIVPGSVPRTFDRVEVAGESTVTLEVD